MPGEKEIFLHAEMRDGLRLGAMLVFCCVLSYFFFSSDVVDVVVSLPWGLGTVTMFCLIRYSLDHRKTEMNDKMSYLQSLSYLSWTSFFSSMIFVIAVYGFLATHDSFVSDFFASMISEMEKIPELSDWLPIYRDYAKELNSLNNVSLAIQVGWTYLFFTIIFSFVVALFVRKS